MNLKSLFKQLPATAYLYGLLAVAVVGGVSTFAYQQRQIGARNAELRLSRHAEDSLAREVKQAQAARIAAEAVARKDSLALVESRRKIVLVSARTDSAVRAADAERQRALALAADSGATLGQLRAQLVALVATTARADSLHAVERVQWAKDTSAANERVRSLSEALAAANVENGKLADINANLHRQINLVERDRAGVVVRYVVPAVAFAVGVGIAR